MARRTWWMGAVLCVGLAGCGSALVAEGDAALEAQDYETAARKYREARAADGDSPEITEKLAQASAGAAAERRAEAEGHEAAGRWTEAQAAWTAALDHAGNDREIRDAAAGLGTRAGAACAAQAHSARAAGDWDATVAAFEQACEWDASATEHTVGLAAALVQRGGAAVARTDFTAAYADYARAVELDPNNADARAAFDTQRQLKEKVDALLAEGAAHEGKDALDAAMASYDAVLEMWPGQPDATARKQALASTKAFLAAFREGVAEMAAERWDAAIAKFEEAATHKQTDLLTQKRDEAHRSKWIARADAALASGAHDEAVQHLEQAQRWAAAASKEWDALAAQIRSVQYAKWMAVGRELETKKDWKAAIKVYERVKAEFANPTDDDLNRRIIAVNDHLVRVRCELCQGSGELTTYKFEGDQQIPTGTESCQRCEGTGTDIQVKQGH